MPETLRYSEVAFGEHVIGRNEDFVSDRENGPQAAAPGLQAVELVLEITAPWCARPRWRPRPAWFADARCLAGTPALLSPGALMIAGAHASPGGQVVNAQEHAHVDADLGDQHGGNHPIDAGNLHQQGMGDAIRLELLVDAPIEGSDVLFGRFEPAQLYGEQESMVLPDPTLEREHQ